MPARDPYFDPPAPSPKDVDGPESVAATSCPAWGVIAMFTWWMPAFGQVFSIAGLIRGYQARQAPNRIRARLGLVLSAIAMNPGLAFIAWIIRTASAMAEF